MERLPFVSVYTELMYSLMAASNTTVLSWNDDSVKDVINERL
jgi:hypothetical protein